MDRGRRLLVVGFAVGFSFAGTWYAAGQAKPQQPAKPTPEVIFTSYKPKQPDVDYETPPQAEWSKCKVEVETKPSSLGYVVLGPEGQVLRRFIDTEDEGTSVDQYRYYQYGIEVYREIDSNGNTKMDQYRWLNLGGSRWGIDRNEDGRIDEWKILSAAEASKEAIRAMTAGDAASLQLVMVTAQELNSLGVIRSIAEKVVESTQGAGAKAQAIVKKSKVLTPQSKWIRFDAQMPSLIPSDEGKATQDLQVFENAMVVIETGPKQTNLVQIGEMVRIGEVWKLTQVPQPVEDEKIVTSGGLLMQPSLAAGSADIPAPSPKLQKLIDALQKLDQNPPQIGSAPVARLIAYNSERANILLQMADAAEGDEEKSQFLKQCVDGLAAAVQTDAFPDGLKQIQTIEAQLTKAQPKSPALPYVIFRRIMATYSADMKQADEEKKPEDQTEKRAEAQKAWLTSLSEFVDAYPAAEDTPDAMWQVATAEEFSGKLTDAVNWYRRLATQKRGTPAADKAGGAIRRLELKGKPFMLAGTSLSGSQINTAAYRSKVLLVVCWATWCEPCKADLPQIRALYKQYKARGFEVLGVCLDIPGGTREQQVAQLQKFVTASDMPWPHIYEPGGLDSPPAVQYGIITLPTMFLIDQKGEVLSRNSSVQELKQVLPTIFK